MIEAILGLAVVGFLVYLLVTYIPMPPPIKTTIIVIVVLWLIVRAVPLLGVRLP